MDEPLNRGLIEKRSSCAQVGPSNQLRKGTAKSWADQK